MQAIERLVAEQSYRVELILETHAHADHLSDVHDGVTEVEFVAMREARDRTLDMPTLILPAVQVNIRAGHLPPRNSMACRT